MIKFDRFTLDNGLKVIVHKDITTPIVAVNILYDVGARDEHPEKTGFAHLFEHLMFGGSVNIPSYDNPLQQVGGENNAFTSNDITNYYCTLPKENIETAFWLESDRMLCLDFSQRNLDVQRNVVIEEFKQRYLNQPYGDVWLLLRPFAYRKHPYRWATIGKDISHIESATLNDVKDFFYRFYAPNNAILTIAGNVKTPDIQRLAEKWFGPIEKRNVPVRKLTPEPVQRKERYLEVVRDVPADAVFKVYHMCSKTDSSYFASDMVSDILSGGNSSRLYQSLVKRKKLFGDISAHILGSHDPGLLVVTGRLLKGVDMARADSEIQEELEKLCSGYMAESELEKVKNKVEATITFQGLSVLNKAMNLAFYELLGDAADYNSEVEKYRGVTTCGIRRTAERILRPSNCSTLYYRSSG